MSEELVLDGVVIPRGSSFAFNYKAAEHSRARDFGWLSSMPQAEWAALPQHERNTIISRLRFLVRNNEYAAAIATTFATHLGNSTLRSKAKAPEYNDAKEKVWLEWSADCEASGLSLAEVEDLIYGELLCAGEVFAILLKTGKIQLIPSEFVFSPDTATEPGELQGITYDGNGAPTAYRIGYRDDKGTLQPGKTLVPAALVKHVYRRERAEQRRGVPWLAAAVPALQDISEIVAAKVLSVKAQSHLSIAITRNAANSTFPTLGDAGNIVAGTTGKANRYATLKSGSLLYLEPGEAVQTISSQFQSQDFDAFLLSRLRAIGASIGMPLELFLEGWRDSNYSSSRATNMVWGRKVRSIRALIDRRFLAPLNLWVSARARAAKALKGTPADDTECDFSFPPLPSIDEAKETQADREKLDAGLTTYTAVYAGRGLFFDDEIKVIARDRRLIAEAAAAEGLTPGDLIPMLAPKAPAPDKPAIENGTAPTTSLPQ